MKTPKPRILLYWGYHRKAWTYPFEKLSEFFDFIYVFHHSTEDELQKRDDLNVLYFKDFLSAKKLLDFVKPTKMIFIGLDGMLSISTNVVAQRMGIETILMQHGFVFNFKDQVRVEHNQNRALALDTPVDPYLAIKRKHYLKFIIRSLGLFDIHLFIRYILVKKQFQNETELERLRRWNTKKRRANRYFLFAPFFDDLYLKKDHVRQEQIEYFGNFEMDEFLRSTENESNNNRDKYLLLIDQPLFRPYEAGGSAKCTYEEAEAFYLKLSRFAELQSCRLIVKLHPYSYAYIKEYPLDENIDFVTEVDDLQGLIRNSNGVFGFYSTLILSAILIKPTCLFRVMEDVSFFDFLRQRDYCEVQPMYDFDLRHFEKKLKTPQIVDPEFVNHFALSTDGESHNRLRILLEN